MSRPLMLKLKFFRLKLKFSLPWILDMESKLTYWLLI